MASFKILYPFSRKRQSIEQWYFLWIKIVGSDFISISQKKEIWGLKIYCVNRWIADNKTKGVIVFRWRPVNINVIIGMAYKVLWIPHLQAFDLLIYTAYRFQLVVSIQKECFLVRDYWKIRIVRYWNAFSTCFKR